MKKKRLAIVILLSIQCVFSAGAFGQDAPVRGKDAVEIQADPAMSGRGVFITKIKETGLTGMVLVLISIVGCSFAFERLSNLRKAKIVPSGFAAECDRLWKANEMDAIYNAVKKKPSTLGRVIALMVDHKGGGHTDVANIAGDVASREMRVHLQRAYPLAVVATVSPLLGLFGTVYGMIGAFESVALAGQMGDPSIMAGDISFALITTALGLVIAVPSLIAYHFFRVRSNILALALEEQVNHLLIRWFPIGN